MYNWKFTNNSIWKSSLELFKKVLEIEKNIPESKTAETVFIKLLSSIEETGSCIAGFSEMEIPSPFGAVPGEAYHKGRLLEVQENILRTANVSTLMKEAGYMSEEDYSGICKTCQSMLHDSNQLGYMLSQRPDGKVDERK